MPQTEYGGGKPPGGKGTGGGGEDDGNNDGSGSGEGSNQKPMKAEEKFALTGIFAGYALTKTLTDEEYEAHKNGNPLTQITAIQNIRDIINDPTFPFKQAWDLQSRQQFFYKIFEKGKKVAWEKTPFNSNEGRVYVKSFVMKECEETVLN